MSCVGVSIGDFFLISALTWRVYKSCKESSDEFRSVSTDVLSMHVVLKEVEDHILDRCLPKAQEESLTNIAQACQTVLNDLETVLAKYESLGTKSQRTWDRMRWGTEEVDKLRARLTTTTTLLVAFNTTVTNSSQARIEKKLNKLLSEIRSGEREGSVISVESVQSIEQNDQETWEELQRELDDVGISGSLIEQHKPFIVRWVKKAIDEGLMEEGAEGFPSEAVLSESITQSNATRSLSEQEDLKEAIAALKEIQPVKPSGDDIGSVRAGSIRPKISPFARAMRPLLRRFSSSTAVHRAARDGDSEKILDMLGKGKDPNTSDSYKLTPLHWAVMRGHLATASLLVQQGVNAEKRDSSGRTALGIAAYQGMEQMTFVLLEHGADIAAQDSEGFTPLHGTAKNRCPRVAGILLKYSPPLDVQDVKGCTPLHWATSQGFSDMVELLINAGANVLLKNKDGKTPLSVALEQGDAGENDITRLLHAAQPRS